MVSLFPPQAIPQQVRHPRSRAMQAVQVQVIAKKEHYLLVSNGMRFTIVKACRQVLSALQ